ncbi:Ankyrin repeat domain-containing protein 42 [Cichlidogyrus casuarinus]|uniref:Ankyrin repeat domain-containing protein 42 n=1 Tax=Cichlidogyrus casuarinus TaxID=1844966 RepID=A0ABD2PZQ5_9PLAT
MYKNIHDAVKSGNVTAVAELVKQGASVNELDCNNMTPLHWAANVGAIEILQWLLWRKADPLILTPIGWNAVHIAAIRGHEACIQTLISRNILCKWGLRLDDTDNMGNTCTHLAAMEGHLPVVQFLVSSCGNKDYVLQSRNDNGETPKSLAQQFLKQNVVDYIEGLERSFAVPFGQDIIDQLAFPAHTAAHRGDLKQLRALIEGGIVKVNERDEQNSTPLHKAAGQGHCEVVQWLVEYGANPALLDDSGESPIDVARRFGQLAILYQLCPNADAEDLQNWQRSLLTRDVDAEIDQNNADLIAKRDGIDFVEDLGPSLADIDQPYGDLEGDPIQLSETEKTVSRNRAKRRMQKLESLYETARQDYKLLGGQPSEAEKLEIRKIREAER